MENKFSDYVNKKLLKEEDENVEATDAPEETGETKKNGSSKILKDFDIKKIFRLKNLDVDDIVHRNDGSVEISMYKEKVSFSKSIDDIAESVGAKDWEWSGTQENPFRVTFYW